MLNEPAGMVSEIICNVLMAFRNESSFAVFFKKKICICAFNSTKKCYKGWRGGIVNMKD